MSSCDEDRHGNYNYDKTQLYVDSTYSNKNGRFKTIHDALIHAKSGTTIYVNSGIYVEDITINAADIKLIGQLPANYYPETDSFGIGVLLKGNINVGLTRGFWLEGISIDRRDQPDGYFSYSSTENDSVVNNKIANCVLVGNNMTTAHGFTCQSGSGWILEDLKIYKQPQAIVLRSSDVLIDNIYLEDCEGNSGAIVIKSEGNDCRNINVNNVIMNSRHLNNQGPILITAHNGKVTENVNINNVSAGGIFVNPSLIWVQQQGGTVQFINISNCTVEGTVSHGFWIQAGQYIQLSNCISVNAGQTDSAPDSVYGFKNDTAQHVKLTGCTAVNPKTGQSSGLFE